MSTTATRVLQDPCTHERSHIVDSRFYGHRYATAASRKMSCDVCRFQRWLEVEAALALVQGDLGMIPASAASGIAEAAQVERLDLDAVAAEIRRTGHSLVGLLRVFQKVCPGDSGEYIHYGATTQDVQDTGQSLEMRGVLDELDQVLRKLVGCLADLAERHAGTVALGRTHAQPALPMGFGLKVTSWIDELLRHIRRLQAMRPRVLVVQMFGAIGTMAGFGGFGPELVERLAGRLDLAAPSVGWHVARDRVVEYVTTVAMVAATMGRIADEIRMLSRPEFGEVAVPWSPGAVGSSTMPHKRNPEACEQVVVLARLAAGVVSAAMACMSGDNERDSRALRLEWVCVPEISHYCLAACDTVLEVVSGLDVHTDVLRRNVEVVSDQLASEALMLALGERLGKQTAHEWVYDVSQAAQSQGRSLRELLHGRDEVAHLSDAELDRIFDPASHMGDSVALTNQVVAEARSLLADRPGAPAGTRGPGREGP